jgi:hypothetical protein
MATMLQSVQVEFTLLVDEQWVPIDTFLSYGDYLLDHYISTPGLYCCNFQGGLFIQVDGQVWSDDGTVDEFWMTMTWLHALNTILDGTSTATAHPWEESRLTLTRVGDALEMEDIHYSGHIAMPRVQVSLADFGTQVAVEFRKFARLLAELKAAIAERRAGGVDDQTDAQLRAVEEHCPVDVAALVDGLDARLRTRA